MSFRVIDGGNKAKLGEGEGRVLAPGAPRSAGPLPLEFAEHLRTGEVVVWWSDKDRIDGRPMGIVALALAAVLAAASLIVPEFWYQPFTLLWPPLAALTSPVLLMWFREAANRRATVVTDTSILDFPRRGAVARVGFDNIVRVRRDPLLGGLQLHGQGQRVRIPPSHTEDARQAIACQRRGHFRNVADGVDDPMGWLS
jgi:hypothetical protein